MAEGNVVSDGHASGIPVAGSRFFGPPASRLGRIASALAAVAFVLIVLMATVVEPAAPLWRTGFGVLIVVALMATAVTGVSAILAKRERSWAVVLPTFVCLGITISEALQQARAFL